MQQKLITFAVPCYNSAAYMRHCIETLLSAGEQAEIILVDDGSVKDETPAICDEYAAKYPTIVKAIHQENGGHGEGVNQGTGASIILLGGAIGFSTGPLNINTTIVAQKIAGLPLYSGVGYRFICFAVFYVITNIYLIRYALKIQKHPELSPMYEIDKTSEFRNAADLDSFGKLDARKILIMLVFFASLILIVYGGITSEIVTDIDSPALVGCIGIWDILL